MRLVVQARRGGRFVMPAVCRALSAIHGECSHWQYQSVVDATHAERQQMFALIPHFDAIMQILEDLNLLDPQQQHFAAGEFPSCCLQGMRALATPGLRPCHAHRRWVYARVCTNVAARAPPFMHRTPAALVPPSPPCFLTLALLGISLHRR